ncbi:hypothetical protein GGR51DRAFT_564104 [Nemania sp. FL0031]|nr:hypothetical protein GGR51DRAFT_564104 [Nemania sp. FL0031]
MLLHASNLPFIIGNDICRVARVRQILGGRLGPQFVRRILRAEEIQNPTTASILRCILDPKARSSQDARSTPSKVAADAETPRDAPKFTRAVEFMAGRFSAKEAVIKAHPHRRLTFQKITLLRAAFITNPNARGGREPNASEQTEKPAIGQNEGEELDSQRDAESDDETSISTSKLQGSGPLVALIRAEGAHGDEVYATVSISHDTEYATAVCLGINPVQAHR